MRGRVHVYVCGRVCASRKNIVTKNKGRRYLSTVVDRSIVSHSDTLPLCGSALNINDKLESKEDPHSSTGKTNGAPLLSLNKDPWTKTSSRNLEMNLIKNKLSGSESERKRPVIGSALHLGGGSSNTSQTVLTLSSDTRETRTSEGSSQSPNLSQGGDSSPENRSSSSSNPGSFSSTGNSETSITAQAARLLLTKKSSNNSLVSSFLSSFTTLVQSILSQDVFLKMMNVDYSPIIYVSQTTSHRTDHFSEREFTRTTRRRTQRQEGQKK